MGRILLCPGELVCDLAGLRDADNRQILRMWINTVVWSLVGVVIALLLL